MKKAATPRPPAGLKASTRRWFLDVVTEWELDPHHHRLLALACQAWDEASAAAAMVSAEGLVLVMPSGAKRPHPAIRIANEARGVFVRCLRELDLDVAPPAEGKRPPSLHSVRFGGKAAS